MADLKLYTNPMSRGRIARWMLEEVGQPYDVEALDYGTTMKAPEYLAVNPMGKVPAVVHRDRIVTECAAICAYLADAFPDAGLAPDPADRADYYRYLFFAAGPLEQAVVDHSMGVKPEGRQQAFAGYGTYDLTVDTLERMLDGREHVSGGRFTAADVYVGSHVAWGLQFGTLPARQAFEAYVGRLRERDAYKRASAKDDALMPAEEAS